MLRGGLFAGLAAGVLAAGCVGWDDPAGGRLATGSEAITHDAKSSVVLNDRPSFRDGGWVMVPVGTRVRVVDDPEERDSPNRIVRVMVLEGENRGRSGYLFRENLRAIP